MSGRMRPAFAVTGPPGSNAALARAANTEAPPETIAKSTAGHAPGRHVAQGCKDWLFANCGEGLCGPRPPAGECYA
jgi:hypothetical protein